MPLSLHHAPKARLGELTEPLEESTWLRGGLARTWQVAAEGLCELKAGPSRQGASCPSTVDITVPQPLPPLSPGSLPCTGSAAPGAAATLMCSQTHQGPGLRLLRGLGTCPVPLPLGLPSREE